MNNLDIRFHVDTFEFAPIAFDYEKSTCNRHHLDFHDMKIISIPTLCLIVYKKKLRHKNDLDLVSILRDKKSRHKNDINFVSK